MAQVFGSRQMTFAKSFRIVDVNRLGDYREARFIAGSPPKQLTFSYSHFFPIFHSSQETSNGIRLLSVAHQQSELKSTRRINQMTMQISQIQ